MSLIFAIQRNTSEISLEASIEYLKVELRHHINSFYFIQSYNGRSTYTNLFYGELTDNIFQKNYIFYTSRHVSEIVLEDNMSLALYDINGYFILRLSQYQEYVCVRSSLIQKYDKESKK